MERDEGYSRDEEIRAENRRATRAGLSGFLNELKETRETALEPNFFILRNRIRELMLLNEERGELALEELDTITLLAAEEQRHKELEDELQEEFPELAIRINPTTQMFGFPGMVKAKRAELVIIDKRFEGELPEGLEKYREEAIFEYK